MQDEATILIAKDDHGHARPVEYDRFIEGIMKLGEVLDVMRVPRVATPA